MGPNSKGKDSDTSHPTSQQTSVEESDIRRAHKIAGHSDDSGELLSKLCKLSTEYVESVTRAEEGLRDYYLGLTRIQLNQFENLLSLGFTKMEMPELLSQCTICAAQLWMDACILPWKLALANLLCIEPVPIIPPGREVLDV